MPVDSEVAKERIWKEHCEKMVLQSMKFRQEGRSHAEFTLNPYHMHHNKPVTDPVSTRSPSFMDRSKATLDALGQRLANTGLSPRGEAGGDDISSPNKAARSNKSRAIKGNNIFGSHNASDESKRKLFEEWSEMLNEELGGGKSFRESSTGFLPPINNPRSPPAANNKQNNNTRGSQPASICSPTKAVDSPSSKRDEVIQDMLIRSSKPPVAKYDRPQLESQVLGWDASRALRPDPMFQFYHKSCDMTRFAAESGHSPSKRGGGAPSPSK